MKSIEEKAKAYDKAFNVALETYQKQPMYRDWLEKMFPELKESDDESIRKELINFFSDKEEFDYEGLHPRTEIIAWLEKQGEPVEINPTEFDTRLQALIGKFCSLPKEELIGSLSFWLNVVQNDGTYKDKEKQGILPKWKYKNDKTPLLRDSIILNKYGCVAKSPAGALVDDVWVINYDELKKLPKEELEKQGEQKPAEEYNIKGIGSKNAQGKLGEMIKNLKPISGVLEQKPVMEGTFVNVDEVREDFMQEVYKVLDAEPTNDKANQIIDAFDHLSTIIIQKPIDKVEPKFKVGDWVIVSPTEGDRVVQIASVEYLKDGYPRYITTEGRWFCNGTKARLLTDKDVETITLPESRAIVKKTKSWSEEDEKIILSIEQVMNCASLLNLVPEKIDKIRTWLKSLRHQKHESQSDEHYELEEFAKIVRGNLTGISKAVQELFEAKYLQLTGNKMYGEFKD